jgi:hypothetical protein
MVKLDVRRQFAGTRPHRTERNVTNVRSYLPQLPNGLECRRHVLEFGVMEQESDCRRLAPAAGRRTEKELVYAIGNEIDLIDSEPLTAEVYEPVGDGYFGCGQLPNGLDAVPYLKRRSIVALNEVNLGSFGCGHGPNPLHSLPPGSDDDVGIRDILLLDRSSSPWNMQPKICSRHIGLPTSNGGRATSKDEFSPVPHAPSVGRRGNNYNVVPLGSQSFSMSGNDAGSARGFERR